MKDDLGKYLSRWSKADRFAYVKVSTIFLRSLFCKDESKTNTQFVELEKNNKTNTHTHIQTLKSDVVPTPLQMNGKHHSGTM